jgi:hypothetical protein
MVQDGEGERKDLFYIPDSMEDSLFAQLWVESVELTEIPLGKDDPE